MKGTVHCMVAELEDTLVTVTLAGCAGTWAAGVMSNNYVVITQLIFDLIALYCIFHSKCSQYIAVLQTDVVIIKPVTRKASTCSASPESTRKLIALSFH